MPGPHQGAHAPRALARADARRAGRRARLRGAHAAAAGPSPEDQLLARERREALSRALAKLPERQRSVFMLSHFEGCTSREVSALTGLNESTVRVHLFRAIRKLRTLLAKRRRTPEHPWRNAVSILDKLEAERPSRRRRARARSGPMALPAVSRRIRTSQACADCRSRFAAFAAGSTDVRADAAAEADELFPPSAWPRSRRRSSAGSKRSSARPASSPSRSSRSRCRRGSSHGSRWIAAAAAAGLIVGVGLGQMMDLRHSLSARRGAGHRDARRAAARRAATAARRPDGQHDRPRRGVPLGRRRHAVPPGPAGTARARRHHAARRRLRRQVVR